MRVRVDDYPGTKPNEFYRHNLENFKRFHEVMFRHGIRYVLGVIPKYFTDEDAAWFAEQPEIEIALHGINHDERFPNEFREHETVQQVYMALSDAKERLEGLSWKNVRGYIPPHNVVDRKTVDALYWACFEELHCGPGTDIDVAMYASQKGLKTVPSFPPFYGRSDELLQRGSVPIILKEDRERRDPFSSKEELCLGLHWTWEHNIGLDHLDRFLSAVSETID